MIDGTQFSIRYPWSSAMIERAKKMTGRHGKGADGGKGGQFASGDISDKLTGDPHIDNPLIAFKAKEKARVRAAKKKKQLAGMSKDDANYDKVAGELKALTEVRDTAIAEFKQVRIDAKKAGYKVDSRGKSVNQNAPAKQPKKSKEELEREQFEADRKLVQDAANLRDSLLKEVKTLIEDGTVEYTNGETISRTKEFKDKKKILEQAVRNANGNDAWYKASDAYAAHMRLGRQMQYDGTGKILLGLKKQKVIIAEYEKLTEDAHGRLMEHYKREASVVREKMLGGVNKKRLVEITEEQSSLESHRNQQVQYEAIYAKNASIARNNVKYYKKRGEISNAEEEALDAKRFERMTTEYRRSLKESNQRIADLESEKVRLLGDAVDYVKVSDPLQLKPIYTNKITNKYKSVVEDGLAKASGVWSSQTTYGESSVAIFMITGRASSAGEIPRIKLSQKDDDYSIVAHEFAHGVEDSNPRVLRSAVNFWKQRTGKETNQLVRLDGYGRTEKGQPDNFPNAYDGKIYRTNRIGAGYESVKSTELISRGTEYMVKNPVAFAEDDPDYFDFMYAVMRAG